jgi:hypothetical protein
MEMVGRVINIVSGTSGTVLPNRPAPPNLGVQSCLGLTIHKGWITAFRLSHSSRKLAA